MQRPLKCCASALVQVHILKQLTLQPLHPFHMLPLSQIPYTATSNIAHAHCKNTNPSTLGSMLPGVRVILDGPISKNKPMW
jgi:hypothetical protein